MAIEGTRDGDARHHEEDQHDHGRRNFLLKGGAAVAGAALAATALDGGSASAIVTPVLTPVYAPAGPFRIFDSRTSTGRISTGQEWLLTRTPDSSVVANCFNLTVTETFGKGWLAVFPGDVAFGGTSSINWFGNGQDLANNAYTELEASNAGIRVRCGGGGTSTHFVIDLVAVLVLVDLSLVSSMAAVAAAALDEPFQVQR